MSANPEIYSKTCTSLVYWVIMGSIREDTKMVFSGSPFVRNVRNDQLMELTKLIDCVVSVE